MSQPVVSHHEAVASAKHVMDLTEKFAKEKGFSYDIWENSVWPHPGYRNLRIRILRWENTPTQADLDLWFAQVEPLMAPGFRRYTSHYDNRKGVAKGNAIMYHYLPDNKRWWPKFNPPIGFMPDLFDQDYVAE